MSSTGSQQNYELVSCVGKRLIILTLRACEARRQRSTDPLLSVPFSLHMHACMPAARCRTLPAAAVRRASSALGPTHGLVPCLRCTSLSRGWEAEDAKRAIIAAYTVFVVGSVG